MNMYELKIYTDFESCFLFFNNMESLFYGLIYINYGKTRTAKSILSVTNIIEEEDEK